MAQFQAPPWLARISGSGWLARSWWNVGRLAPRTVTNLRRRSHGMRRTLPCQCAADAVPRRGGASLLCGAMRGAVPVRRDMACCEAQAVSQDERKTVCEAPAKGTLAVVWRAVSGRATRSGGVGGCVRVVTEAARAGAWEGPRINNQHRERTKCSYCVRTKHVDGKPLGTEDGAFHGLSRIGNRHRGVPSLCGLRLVGPIRG